MEFDQTKILAHACRFFHIRRKPRRQQVVDENPAAGGVLEWKGKENEK